MAHDHAAHGHAPDYKADARAAYMGLVFGAIALLVLCFAIVKLTSRKFEGHAAAPAATTTAPHD